MTDCFLGYSSARNHGSSTPRHGRSVAVRRFLGQLDPFSSFDGSWSSSWREHHRKRVPYSPDTERHRLRGTGSTGGYRSTSGGSYPAARRGRRTFERVRVRYGTTRPADTIGTRACKSSNHLGWTGNRNGAGYIDSNNNCRGRGFRFARASFVVQDRAGCNNNTSSNC